MRIRVGTSGWSYPGWKGAFYPEKIAAKDMLRFYGTRFSTVEVNNTFYRMPKKNVLESWAADVPDDFSFVLKASQRITHMRRLKGVEEPLGFLVNNSATLGAKRGPFLIQLPPTLRKDVPRLETFLALLPADTRAALEFRHVSWFDDEVFAALRAKNAALVIDDTGEEGDAPFVPTAGWGYLRMRRMEYSDADLEMWRARIRESGWDETFVFFKHEDEPSGPLLAARFLPPVEPPLA
ncbi:MAG: DUF72 domain-containing protein [Candidatus Eiseniibacteriota bacterium]